jgi:hypothetical protein
LHTRSGERSAIRLEPIDHPPGPSSHDDISNCVAGVVAELAIRGSDFDNYHADYVSITAGICDRRNGVQGSVLPAPSLVLHMSMHYHSPFTTISGPVHDSNDH